MKFLLLFEVPIVHQGPFQQWRPGRANSVFVIRADNLQQMNWSHFHMLWFIVINLSNSWVKQHHGPLSPPLHFATVISHPSPWHLVVIHTTLPCRSSEQLQLFKLLFSADKVTRHMVSCLSQDRQYLDSRLTCCPVFQIPSADIRAYPWRPEAVMFYTGNNPQVAREITDKMLPAFAFPPAIPTPLNNKFLQMAENEVGWTTCTHGQPSDWRPVYIQELSTVHCNTMSMRKIGVGHWYACTYGLWTRVSCVFVM